MDDLKKYQLKPEFKNLFINLARGEELLQKAAFDSPGGVNRKIYDSKEEARFHVETLEKLVKLDLVTLISTGVTAEIK